MTRLWTLVLAVASLIVAGAASGDAVKTELKKFEGRWKVVRFEVWGESENKEDFPKIEVTFKGAEMIARGFKGSDEEERISFTIDPEKKTIDMVAIVKSGKKEKDKKEVITAKKVTLPGIYAFEDGKLKICLPTPEKATARPKEFRSTKEDGTLLMVLEKK